MPSVYKTPGVYVQEIFLPLPSALPTGIPAFVGFAWAIAPLEKLPDGIQFPDSVANRISYEADNKRLVFKDVMSQATRDELLALSPDQEFKQAIEALFQSAQQVVTLYRKQDFTNQLLNPPVGFSKSYLADAVNGFFENGGIRCYVVRADGTPDIKQSLINSLNALAPLNDLDLVAIPDAMILSPDKAAIIAVQQATLQHCAQMGDRIAVLDALPVEDDILNTIQWQRSQLVANQMEPINGALYFPWLRNTNTQEDRFIPPCGHIAGVIARSDNTRGVFKAPANEEILDVLDLEVLVDDSLQGKLNPDGINCLRVFPGRGFRVWGARTLSQDINWRYINIRRLFLTLARWIDQNMAWAAFEPNSPFLWVQIQRELSAYLETLWQVGALKGQTSEQAFYVRCDGETNPPELRENGEVVTEVGLAPNSPAEFIIARIVHRVGSVAMQ